MSTPLALTGNVGDFILIKSNQIDAYGQTSATAVVWSSSDASKATVSNVYDKPGYGLINYIAAGTATITATAGSVNTTILLTVVVPSAATASTITVETVAPAANRTIQTQTHP